jgi:hypothetical protein
LIEYKQSSELAELQKREGLKEYYFMNMQPNVGRLGALTVEFVCGRCFIHCIRTPDNCRTRLLDPALMRTKTGSPNDQLDPQNLCFKFINQGS